VPDERVQEEAGQRQDRTSHDMTGRLSYQRVLSSAIVADLRAMIRGVGVGLSSNEASTPIAALQDRAFQEAYIKGTVAGHAGPHEWRAGLDATFGSVREAFSYALTDTSAFDLSTPVTFSFADRATDREQAMFVQDQLRLGSWTINVGLRCDHYRLMVNEHSVSPRLGVAWWWPRGDLVVRAFYDRAFQTPAIENLLLASSPAVDNLDPAVVRLPVPPSRGHFVEAGISKRLLSFARIDVTQFSRHIANFADDDVLLNTGVSFPIAFDRGDVHGTEVKFDEPSWRAGQDSSAMAICEGPALCRSPAACCSAMMPRME
jgi:outer membrane receptor protein involved in Fe transport